MIRAVSCLAIALLVSTPGAFAADAATCGEQFRAADLNNDGVLSRSEIGDAKSKLPSGIFRTRIYHAHRLYGRMHQQRLIGRRKLLSVVRTIRHVKAADQPRRGSKLCNQPLAGAFCSIETQESDHGRQIVVGWDIVGWRGRARLLVLGQPAQHSVQGTRRRNQEELTRVLPVRVSSTSHFKIS